MDLNLVERHEVYRLLDLDQEKQLVYCRDCPFSQLRDAKTLDLVWQRTGSPGVMHAGGILAVGMQVRPDAFRE